VFNGCSHETLLHIGPPGPLWSICYYHQDLHSRRLQPGSHPEPSAPPARPAYSFGCRGLGSPALPLLRQVSCYTLLSGFRLPWPPSCCLKQPTPFVGSDELPFWHFNLAFGSSHSASSAYQKWPTRHSDSVSEFTQATRTSHPFKV